MKMKYSTFKYLFLLLLLSSRLFAQDSITLAGSVKDYYSKSNLPFANISIKNSYIGTSTNEFGKFKFKIPTTLLPISVTANYMGYSDTSLQITQKRNQNCSFLLYPNSIDLNEITVNYEKNVIFGNRTYQILDYLLADDKILLITYKRSLFKSILVMTDLFGKIQAAIPIKGKPIKLYTDCVNMPFLVCQSVPYMIHIRDTTMTLQRAYQDKFNKLLKPCVASLNNVLFYKYMGPFDLSLAYYTYNLVNNDFELYTRIDDEFQQALFVNDFNYLLRSNGIKILGNTNNYEALRKFKSKDLKELFRYNMFHQPVYAPLFPYNNDILIFDHANSYLNKFDVKGVLIDSVSINYQHMKGWEPLILFDEIGNKFYTISEKNSISIFYNINIKNGHITEVKRVPYSWIEKPCIRNNTLYFLYRREDKNSAKYLYFEDL